MDKRPWDELMKLTPAERIELAQDLWDSICPEELPPPAPEQMKEVRRRFDEHRRDPSRTLSLEEFQARLRSRFE
jgi:putative addiction module component (TIGR02574 family)